MFDPIASIIVLSYNGLEETTRPCLESVVKNTADGAYELIIVDNASSDGTVEYLKSFAASHVNTKLHLNTVNKGYAGGNNDGLRLANGRYIVLLNNDTLVPEGWLDRLLQLFKVQPEIGLVGPITNSAGNEQRIELNGLTEFNYEEISAGYIKRQEGVWFTTKKLGFFCVAMRAEVPKQIGLLDEGFGLGMFEDDDYCVRAEKAGFQIAVTEGCFVYHKGSMSFKKLDTEQYQEIFEKNKNYFREKNGVEWTFSEIAIAYWEKTNKDLSAYISDGNNKSADIERIAIRHQNFRHLLIQLHHVELINSPKKIKNATINRSSSSVIWHLRRENLRRSLINGTWQEKIEYIFRLSKKIVNIKHQDNEPALSEDVLRIISDLKAIKDTLNGRKLIIFPATVDYGYMTQRPQCLAKEFSRQGFVVIYGTQNHQVDKVQIIDKVDENLYVMNEPYFIFIPHVFFPFEVIYYCLWPNNIKHLDYLPYSYLIYDYMDELSLLGLDINKLNEDHKNLIEKSDLITVSSDRLMEQLPSNCLSKTLLINNATSNEFIDSIGGSIEENIVDQSYKKIIFGYYGAIAEWMDFDLIEKLASRFTDERIILIGPISAAVSDRVAKMLWKFSNVTVLPPVPHNQIAHILNSMDICLIPFLKNSVTDAISPVKLFEYLGSGNPVVTSNLIECFKYDTLKIAETHEEFIEFCTELSENLPTKNLISIEIAKKNTWEERVRLIIQKISI